MSNDEFYQELAQKYDVPAIAVRALAEKLLISDGKSVRFDIEALGGKGIWKANQQATVGNGFNQALNDRVTGLCRDLTQAMFSSDEEEEPASSQPRSNLDDTIELMPASLTPNWWPEKYGDKPDISGNAGSRRYVYFAAANRLVIRQNLRDRIFDTSGYEVEKLTSGPEQGFFNLEVHTSTGTFPITHFEEIEG